jgi:surface protein
MREIKSFTAVCRQGSHCLMLFFGGFLTSVSLAAPTDDFVTTWKTDNPGSSGPTEITIPMIGGPYEVDWNNDGIFDQTGLNGPVTHDFGAAGTYTVRVRGDYTSIQVWAFGDFEKILSIEQWGTGAWQTMERAFDLAVNLQVPATDTPDFSAVTSMASMFTDASLANPDTSGWDTSQVTDMALMFFRASSADPDTSGWDTSQVTNMRDMFGDASSADPDTSGWDTSQVTNMAGMFFGASLADPDTSGWDTSQVTDMAFMFFGASLANPDTSGWDTSQVTNKQFMFSGANSADPDTSGWDTGAVTDTRAMFQLAGLANPDTSGWDTSQVTDMSFMFNRASSADPDTSGWDTSQVMDMESMFNGASSSDPDTSGWNVESLETAENMFQGSGLTTANYDVLLENWSQQAVQPNVLLGAPDVTYCSEAAAVGRSVLTEAPNDWIITDQGQDCLFRDRFEGVQ